jgi:hypothetical protein
MVYKDHPQTGLPTMPSPARRQQRATTIRSDHALTRLAY